MANKKIGEAKQHSGQPLSPPVQLTIRDFLPSKEARSTKERLILLLSEGHNVVNISKWTGATKANIYKTGQRAEKRGFLKKESQNPVLYGEGVNFQEGKAVSFGQLSSAAHKKVQLLVPHRFPVYYKIGSKTYRNSLNLPEVDRQTWKAKKDEQPGITAIWGTKTLILWIKTFRRAEPHQEVEEGLERAAAYASAHQGGMLRFWHLGKRIEWVFRDRPLSDTIRDRLGLKLNQPLFLAGAAFVIDDTHPENVEVNKAAQGAAERPTEIAKLADILFSPEKFWADYQRKSELILLQEQVNAKLQEGIILLEKKIKEMEAKRYGKV